MAETSFAPADRRILTRRRWESIYQARGDFIAGRLADPLSCPDIDPTIAASWLRCKANGVNPEAGFENIRPGGGPELSAPPLPQSPLDFELTRLSAPLLAALESWRLIKNLSFCLDSIASDRRLLASQSMTPAMPWSIPGNSAGAEISIGTNAVALARISRHPICVQGPEAYCHKFDPCFLAAAPIFDYYGEMVAILKVGTLAAEGWPEPWDERIQNTYALLLGAISSLAAAIGDKLRLTQGDKALKASNSLMEKALSLVDLGVIVISRAGKIKGVNKTAVEYLGIGTGPTERDLQQFLSERSQLIKAIQAGENLELEEAFLVGGDYKRFSLKLRSFGKNPNDLEGGAVLSLQKSAGVNKTDLEQSAGLARGADLEQNAGLARGADLAQSGPAGPGLLASSEKNAIASALGLSGGNIAKAAKLLRVSRTTLYRKIDKYQIPTGKNPTKKAGTKAETEAGTKAETGTEAE
jgi:transcriptional regulator of acetoin/glycerol metabolism